MSTFANVPQRIEWYEPEYGFELRFAITLDGQPLTDFAGKTFSLVVPGHASSPFTLTPVGGGSNEVTMTVAQGVFTVGTYVAYVRMSASGQVLMSAPLELHVRPEPTKGA